MSIADKLTTIAENQQRVYNKGFIDGQNAGGSGNYEQGFADGKQAEYDKFWDGYQQNGNRNNYAMAFAQLGWIDEIFNPKYDLTLTIAAQMFNNSRITTLASKLKEKGLKFDTSALTGTGALQMFQSSSIKDVPELDLRNCTNIGYLVGSGAKVETIEKLIISEKTTTGLNTAFNNAKQLIHCLFGGVLAITGLDMSACTLLDKESITSLVGILSTTTSGLSVTLSKQAVNKAFETSENANNGSNSTEWTTLVNTKQNWTINLS